MSAVDERPPHVGRSVLLRAGVGALAVVLLTAGAVATTVLLQVKQAADVFFHNSHAIPHIGNALGGVQPGGPQTILVIGSDHRYADTKAKLPSRSDTLMLVRLDPDKGATAVMSIPRDLKVEIPLQTRTLTDKINASYAIGGPVLTVRTVTHLLHIPINHVVNVNFGGFQRAVNRLGCVYTDVDRRYYHSNAGLPPSQQYSEINLKPGYQRLCGADALSYVRYRHTDTDIVRSARQQDFLRQAKAQFGLGRLFGDRDALLRIFGRYTQTDINSETAILRLLKLAFESAKNPIQEVHFTAEEDNTKAGDYLVATPQDIQRTVDQFISAKGSTGARAKAKLRPSDRTIVRRQRSRARHSHTQYPGLFDAGRAAEDQAIRVGAKVHFPVYFPTLALIGSQYVTDPATPRAYTIRDRSGRAYAAYRLVIAAPGFGQYYGVQGTTWRAPPILDNPDEHRRMAGRTYDLYYDGSRLRLVALRTPRAVYWISNTLLQTVGNRQMLGIARSLRRLGS